MTVAILHLTDIHIEKKGDAIVGRGGLIASAVLRHLNGVTRLIVLLSGDIAQAGQKAEYELAGELLSSIKYALAQEFSELPIDFVVAPGNHDCDFSERNEVRDGILSLVEAKAPDIPGSYIDVCTKIQANYLAFREELSAPLMKVQDDKLWTTYNIEAEGRRIYIDVLNASWMSTRHEKQGNLFFPFERYASYKPTEADFRIGVLHHPFGWYSQRNQLKFRAFMHSLCDVIFTGHEHGSAARVADDLSLGECAYVEGATLFERHTGSSGFNVVMLDLVGKRFQYVVYQWAGERYEPASNCEWVDYRKMARRAPGEFDFSERYHRQLIDPGATLRHPSGRDLVLDDIYVYPDLDRRGADKESRSTSTKVSACRLLQLPSKGESALIEGVESAGKTRLLYQLASNYRLLGFLPVLIRGAELRGGPTEANVDGFIKAAFVYQYSQEAFETFQQAPKVKKVLLLDDFDACKLKREFRTEILEKLVGRFHSTVVTVSDDYEFTELLSTDEPGIFESFETYRISAFGYQRRGELIRKWMALGADEETSKNELLQMEDDATKFIESARIQHVAASVPIFILSILQGSASGLSKELQNTSFANYYHFLIVGALERANVAKDRMPTFIAACTHLSWFVKKYGADQRINHAQFRQFVDEYSLEWTATDHEELMETLLRARILRKEGEEVSFAYPYAYYYFLGRYTSLSQDVPEVREFLAYCMQHLYVRECANALLFLAHHTGTSAVLDQLAGRLNRFFSGRQPATLSKKDVAVVAQLVSNAPKLEYQEKLPEEYRDQQAQWQDEHDSGSDGLKDQPTTSKQDDEDIEDQIVGLNKSIEIAGALLSHQFANYNRTNKQTAIAAIFDASMRAVRRFYEYFEQSDAEELIKSSAGRLSKHANFTREEAEQHMRIAVGWLIRAITTGLVRRAGASLTPLELDDNIAAVVEANPTNANRLVRVSQILAKPVPLPKMDIEALLKAESDNPCVMGVLQYLVLDRLYMYETKSVDKRWAMSTFKLEGYATAVELRHRKQAVVAR